MSVQSEITRLETAKADIKTAIKEKGVTVPDNATLEHYGGYIRNISNADTVDGIHLQILSSAPTTVNTSMLTFVAQL